MSPAARDSGPRPLLAIDAGNTSVSFALLPPSPTEAPLARWRVPTHPLPRAGELRAAMLAGTAGFHPDGPDAIVLSSVVPAVTRLAKEEFPGLLVIDASWPFSFRIATENPARTGVDRLVNAEAFVREQPGSAILVDAGTATTVCAIEAQTAGRVFLGGAILPGPGILRDALADRAALLYAVPLEAPAAAIGRDTDSALKSGVVLGYASMVDGMIARFREELPRGAEPRVIATGGHGALLHDLCREIQNHDPDLTFKGIRYLYESFRTR